VEQQVQQEQRLASLMDRRGRAARLQQLAQPGHDAAADELREVQAGRADAGRVRAAQAVDPLHHQDARPAQVRPHPRDLHRRVVRKVATEILWGIALW